MITLIDQSETEKLKFHCDICDQVFVQPSRYFLDLHSPFENAEAQKRGIPVCRRVAVAVPVAAAPAPKAKRQKAAAVAVPVVEGPAPKKRGRPRKTEVAP